MLAGLPFSAARRRRPNRRALALRRRRRAERRRSLRQDALNVPNVLTMGRVAIIPLVLWLLDRGTPSDCMLAAIIYSLAALTDLLDGYLARRMNVVSVLGKFLDPLCDKIFLAVILVTLLYLKVVPLWAVVLIVLRDFLILLGSYIILRIKSVVEVSNVFGKITGFIFGAMILAFTINLTLIGTVLMYLSIIVMTVAFITYSVNYLRIMKGVE